MAEFWDFYNIGDSGGTCGELLSGNGGVLAELTGRLTSVTLVVLIFL